MKKIRENDEEKLIAHEREFELIKNMSHPNLIKVVETFFNKSKSEVSIVMEYIEGKEIFDVIGEIGSYNEMTA